MKALNKSILALAAMVAAVFTGCNSESDVENFYPGPQSPGAFFPASLPSTVNLSETDGVFTVDVMRTENTADKTYAVSATDASGLFTIPASVTFSGNATSAPLTITYDPAALTYNKQYPISVKVSDASLYGAAEYSFKAVMAEPWSDWAFVNGGTFVYNGFWSGYDDEVECSHRYSLKNAADQQFLLTHWGAGYDFLMNYNAETNVIEVPIQKVYDHSSYGDVFVAGLATYIREVQGSATTGIDGVYNPETGLFQMQTVYYCSAGRFSSGNLETFQLDGFPDCSADVDFVGTFFDPDGHVYATVQTVIGADATGKVAVGTQSVSDILNGILDGSIESVEVPSGTTETRIPVDEIGEYNAVVVSFNADGEAQKYAETSFTIKIGAEDPFAGFEQLGEGEIKDNILAPMYGISEDNAYLAANIWKSTETEGLYLVEKMFAGYGIPTAANIVIDATVPTFVMIEPQFIGFQDQSDGPTRIATATYIATGGDKSLESAYINAGYPMVTMNDGVIYFEGNATRFNWPDTDDKWYSSRNEWNGYIALPGAEPVESEGIAPVAPSSSNFSVDGKNFSYKSAVKSNVNRLERRPANSNLRASLRFL